MTNLKIRQKGSSRSLTLENDEQHNGNDDVLDQFPLPRYFQIHFQHVHENTDALRSEISQLKQYVTALETKLDQLLMILDETPKPSS